MDTNFTKLRKMSTKGEDIHIVLLCGYIQTNLNKDMIRGMKFNRYEKMDCNLLAKDLGMQLFYFNKNFISNNDYYRQYIKFTLRDGKIDDKIICRGKSLEGYFINSIAVGFFNGRYVYPLTAGKLEKPLMLNKTINCKISLNEYVMPMKLNVSLTND